MRYDVGPIPDVRQPHQPEVSAAGAEVRDNYLPAPSGPNSVPRPPPTPPAAFHPGNPEVLTTMAMRDNQLIDVPP